MRPRKIVGAMLVASIALSFGQAHAAPETGSPLVGNFCSKGGAITGTGASFAANAVNKVFIPAYNTECGKGSVTYTATGSAAGIAGITNRSVAWGGSDDPLGPDQWATAAADAVGLAGRVSPVHHIPWALGAVTVSYNLASCNVGQEALKLTSLQIALIFDGLVTNWNDANLSSASPKLAACNKAIKLAVRADGSGTTYAFKDFLSKQNPAPWNAYKNTNLNTAWPSADLGLSVPIRGTGNGGVASAIKANDGAIGYVEYSTAVKSLLTWALVGGLNQEFNRPGAGTAANCNTAASGATYPASTLSPGWDAVTITDSPLPDAYAICTFTYALIYNDLKSAYGSAMSDAQAQTLVDLVGLAVSGPVQAQLNQQYYDALPAAALQIARAGVATINLN